VFVYQSKGRLRRYDSACVASRRVWMSEIVLSQQIFPIIVSIRRAHDAMDVLLRGLRGIGRELAQVCRPLVVKLNQDHGLCTR
jgi:hypothetical protein